MDDQRYKELQEGDNIRLTEEEFAEGWHFCWDWDGLLVGPGCGELSSCSCLPEDHKVYKTIPDEHPDTLPDPADNIEAGNIHDDR